MFFWNLKPESVLTHSILWTIAPTGISVRFFPLTGLTLFRPSFPSLPFFFLFFKTHSYPSPLSVFFLKPNLACNPHITSTSWFSSCFGLTHMHPTKILAGNHDWLRKHRIHASCFLSSDRWMLYAYVDLGINLLKGFYHLIKLDEIWLAEASAYYVSK